MEFTVDAKPMRKALAAAKTACRDLPDGAASVVLVAANNGKAPQDPDDVPRAQRMLADAERTLANPGAGWTIELCAAAGEIRLVVGDA